jgi:hypothetical protein
MNARLSVSSASSSQSVTLPDPGLSPLTQKTGVFPWVVSSGESEGLTLTREILADPNALIEIAAARDEIARGDVVRGVDNVRALRPRR